MTPCFFLEQKAGGLFHQLIEGKTLGGVALGVGRISFYLPLLDSLSSLLHFVLCPTRLTSTELLSSALWLSRYVQSIGNTRRFKGRRSYFKHIRLHQGPQLLSADLLPVSLFLSLFLSLVCLSYKVQLFQSYGFQPGPKAVKFTEVISRLLMQFYYDWCGNLKIPGVMKITSQ